MKITKIIAVLILVFTSAAQAQHKANSSDNRRTIEINNDNGELTITFLNDEITEFIVNDEPIAKEHYTEYQEIIDNFSQEEVAPPIPPTPPTNDDDHVGDLRTMMTEHLMNTGMISSFKKYNIHLNIKFIELNGQKLSDEIHNTCLDFFHQIYGHKLNPGTDVKFKKSKNKSKSSVTIKNNQ